MVTIKQFYRFMIGNNQYQAFESEPLLNRSLFQNNYDFKMVAYVGASFIVEWSNVGRTLEQFTANDNEMN